MIGNATRTGGVLVLGLLLSVPLGAQGEPESSSQIAPGKIPLSAFFSYLAASEKKSVVRPAKTTVPAFGDDAMLNITHAVDPLTFPVARAILAVNGYHVSEGVDRTPTLEVRFCRDPEHEVQVICGTCALMAAERDPPGTRVFPLEHADVTDVKEVVQYLIEAWRQEARVEIASPSTLVFRAPQSVRTHLETILGKLDVPFGDAPTTIEIVSARVVKAGTLVGLLEALLDLPESNTSKHTTRLHADERGAKIILQTTDPAAPERVTRLIDQLDQSPASRRPDMHVYRVRHLAAADLAEQLGPLLPPGNGDVVADVASNSLLIRLEYTRYLELLHVLETIDVEPRPIGSPRVPVPFEIAIVDLLHADPVKIASILNERVAAREGELSPGLHRTRFVPHPTARQLIVRYTDEEWLREYREAVSALDRPPENSPVLRVYRCRHRNARDVQAEITEKWTTHPEIQIVTQEAANAIVVRLPSSRWSELESELRSLDRKREARK